MSRDRALVTAASLALLLAALFVTAGLRAVAAGDWLGVVIFTAGTWAAGSQARAAWVALREPTP